MRSRPSPSLAKKVILSAPWLVPKLLRFMYHKHIRADLDYLRGDGLASKPPIQISLRITNACNHRCAVCGQYGSKGYMSTDKGRELLKVLPVERYKQLIDEVAFYKPVLYVTGGEPFLYPRMMEVMNYAAKKGLAVTIVTNGVRLKECAEEIIKNAWGFVLVSLDGPEEIHDRCRNLKGAFRTACDGIAALKRCRESHNKKLPYIMTSTTLSQANADYLTDCFKIGEELRPDVMVLYLSWFTSERIGLGQQEILKSELGESAFTWKSYAKSFTAEEAQRFANAITAIKKQKWSFDYFIIPDVGDERYAKYYTAPENLFGYAKCVAPFIMVDIMPNGDVTTCRDFVDIKVGNIMEKPLLEIWNGKKFMNFRKTLIKYGGTFPQCSRCCGLMGF